jgi:hypothetical protein
MNKLSLFEKIIYKVDVVTLSSVAAFGLWVITGFPLSVYAFTPWGTISQGWQIAFSFVASLYFYQLVGSKLISIFKSWKIELFDKKYSINAKIN